MGSAIAAICGVGLWQAQWCLAETSKGRRLADTFGATRALLLLRLVLLIGVAFGIGLAAGLVNPMTWQ